MPNLVCTYVCDYTLYGFSVQIGAGSVIEYCIVSKGVQIGTKCVLSNLYIPVSVQVQYIHICNNVCGVLCMCTNITCAFCTLLRNTL